MPDLETVEELTTTVSIESSQLIANFIDWFDDPETTRLQIEIEDPDPHTSAIRRILGQCREVLGERLRIIIIKSKAESYRIKNRKEIRVEDDHLEFFYSEKELYADPESIHYDSLRNIEIRKTEDEVEREREELDESEDENKEKQAAGGE